MSFQIDCPNCGLRPVDEFRYGGPVQSRPDPSADDAVWTAYLYNKPNIRGLQTEWWYHRAACQSWFVAQRNTQTNSVTRTEYFAPEEDSGD